MRTEPTKQTETKIYTRKGDLGQTSLFGGEKVFKDDLRVQTYGTLDELQASLGLARALTHDESGRSIILEIQQNISIACAELASNRIGLLRLKRRLGAADTTKLEGLIDKYTELYGQPHGFIVPGRSPDSAAVHVARTVCRRGERMIVMVNRQARRYDELITYFNRLSDFLFVLAWSLEVMFVVENAVHEVTAGVSR